MIMGKNIIRNRNEKIIYTYTYICPILYADILEYIDRIDIKIEDCGLIHFMWNKL